MDDNNNIFDALEKSSKIEKMLVAPSISSSNNIVLPTTKTAIEPVRKKGRNKLVDELGFRNPGPKNVVTTVSSRRTKNARRNSTQERTGRSRPVYDSIGLSISDKSDRCDCNRKACSGNVCFTIHFFVQKLTNMNSLQTPSTKCSNLTRQNHQQQTQLDCSLTSIDWLPNMKIEKSITSVTPSITLSTTTAANMNQITTTTLPSHDTTSSGYRNQKLSANYCEGYSTLQPNFTPDSALLIDEQKSMQHPLNDFIHQQPCEQHQKPPYSYVTLIRRAILSTPSQRMTLNEIYHSITEKYPYFKTAPPKWKNSIRHNLSLNKCFKKVQRGMNDPGKGSYWTVDDLETNLSMRKRRPEDLTHLQNLCSAQQQPQQQASNSSVAYFNNPMIYDINSIAGQSSSTDDSDSTMALTPNSQWMPEDINIELTASFRRFREQVLDSNNPFSTGKWMMQFSFFARLMIIIFSLLVDVTLNNGCQDLFPNGESFLESVKMAGSGEINWNDIKLEPYCELLDIFRASSTFQDRDQLINLASSLSNFFDYTGITNMVQSRTHDARSLNCVMNEPNDLNPLNIQMPCLPVVIEEDTNNFDWDSIT
ncbi:unnamed protein product [Didymodactylos carnosus]|uniref:Fork-head domain-containing protein n=1 Tax=Didymodactylos carnosus TaxID=1234261 RepID=A0A813ZAH6_9BILA|nr:unnamed protein product [Didymodactylos carnosus]CAF0895747.1 unnamed protein product [Didymodactylos carnosus]CAF3632734.1 unnamed protein product [Didymodactylos carnosus]CAF3679131.1 unnamed protein product [Didymodactylos carnosus]